MAGRVEGVSPAGAYNPVPYCASDEAAELVRAASEAFAEKAAAAAQAAANSPLFQTGQPAAPIVSMILDQGRTDLCHRPSAYELLRDFLSALMPSDVVDLVSNLAALVLIAAVAYSAYCASLFVWRWCCCRRGGGNNKPSRPGPASPALAAGGGGGGNGKRNRDQDSSWDADSLFCTD